MVGLNLNLGLGLGSRGGGGESYNGNMAMEIVVPAGGGTLGLPITGNGTYFPSGYTAGCSIDWGDGSTPDAVNASGGTTSHAYAAGTFVLRISGKLAKFGNGSYWPNNVTYVTKILSFGTLGIKLYDGSFMGATALTNVATDFPTGVTSINNMFRACTNAAFNPDVSLWDTSLITIISGAFMGDNGAAFNPDMSLWDVRKVTDFSYAFRGCNGASFRGCRGASGVGMAAWKITTATPSMAEFLVGIKAQGTAWLDAILLSWAARIGIGTDPLAQGVTIDFGAHKYTSAAATAYSLLTTNAAGWTAWTITCGGQA